jgi:hypothetical protein
MLRRNMSGLRNPDALHYITRVGGFRPPIGKNVWEEERDHGLDDPDSRRDLHRPGNQRLSAG